MEQWRGSSAGCSPADGERVTLRSPFRVALAAAFVLLALAIVALWKIGPVVAVLTESHGVHAGDALAAIPALARVALVRMPRRLSLIVPPRMTAQPAPA